MTLTPTPFSSSPPRVPEGQIPRPRGGHTPRRHRLHSDSCQEGPGAGERRAAQLREGEDPGQEGEWRVHRCIKSGRVLPLLWPGGLIPSRMVPGSILDMPEGIVKRDA